MKINKLLPLILIPSITASVAPAIASCSKAVEFATDSWKTVINTCNKGFVAFAKAYCNYEGNDETEAITAIKAWIHTQDNARYMDLSLGKFKAKASVRVIDVNHDQITNSNQKAKFTFEFMDIIDVSLFDIKVDGDFWYNPDVEEGKNSILRAYMNDHMLDYLPKVVRNNLKHVDKETAIYIEAESKHKSCITSDLLFPLSCDEFNAKINWIGEDEQTPTEGEVYEYYINAEQPYDEAEKLRVKCYMGSYTAFNYWTRTWNTANCGVVYDGGIHPGYSPLGGLGVAPGFCI